jgi:hypothetical protein
MPIVSKIRGNAVPIRAFVLSRVGLFVFVYIMLVLFPARGGKGYWHAFPKNRFLDGWTRFDAGWYVRVAKFGYKNIPTKNGQDTNFFPMYPLIIREVGKVLGNVYLAGILVSNICFLIALIGLYILGKERYGPEVAARTVYLLAFNPFSFFFSAAYTESLFLCFVVLSFLFCEREQFFLAGLFAAGAGATRNIGIFTIVGLGLIVLQRTVRDGRRLNPGTSWLLLGLAGPLSYITFLLIRFGDPLLFFHAQKAWGTFNPQEVLQYIFQVFRHGSIISWGYPALFLAYAFLGFLAIFIVLWRGKFLGFPYVVFSLLLILPAFLRFTGMGRYLIVAFPLFVALGKLTEKQWSYWLVLSMESAFLILFSFMFSHWYWVA